MGIKANISDRTAYIFIPLEKAAIREAYEEYILCNKDTGLSEETDKTILEILGALK